MLSHMPQKTNRLKTYILFAKEKQLEGRNLKMKVALKGEGLKRPVWTEDAGRQINKDYFDLVFMQSRAAHADL